jgi:hypothetical protein
VSPQAEQLISALNIHVRSLKRLLRCRLLEEALRRVARRGMFAENRRRRGPPGACNVVYAGVGTM